MYKGFMATQTGSSLKCGELWLSSIPKNVSNTAPERHLAVPTPNKAWFYINALKELFMKSLRVIKLTNATYYISNSNVIHSTLYTFHHALVIQVMYQKLFLLVSPITNLHFTCYYYICTIVCSHSRRPQDYNVMTLYVI